MGQMASHLQVEEKWLYFQLMALDNMLMGGGMFVGVEPDTVNDDEPLKEALGVQLRGADVEEEVSPDCGGQSHLEGGLEPA